jgi:hypothetical protein
MINWVTSAPKPNNLQIILIILGLLIILDIILCLHYDSIVKKEDVKKVSGKKINMISKKIFK